MPLKTLDLRCGLWFEPSEAEDGDAAIRSGALEP